MSEFDELQREPLRLLGSRDPGTGQTYFPRRAYAADGSLRETEPVILSPRGTLYSWTALSPEMHYGQIDLPEGVRIQCEIAPGDHAIGADYTLCLLDDRKWGFRRD